MKHFVLKGYAVAVSVLLIGAMLYLMTVLNAEPPAIKVRDTSEAGL